MFTGREQAARGERQTPAQAANRLMKTDVGWPETANRQTRWRMPEAGQTKWMQRAGSYFDGKAPMTVRLGKVSDVVGTGDVRAEIDVCTQTANPCPVEVGNEVKWNGA